MFKTLFVLGMFLWIGFVNVVFASEGGMLGRYDSQTEFELGLEIYGFEYEEPNFMKDEGVFGGIYTAFTYVPRKNKGFLELEDLVNGYQTVNRFKVDARFAYGQVDYTSNSTGSLDNIDDYVFELRATAGMDFPVFESSRFTPYVGLGYRYLNDDTGGLVTTTGAAGYERESNYFYIPLGLEFYNDYSDTWAFGLHVEYDFFIAGSQKSHLEDVNPAFNTIDNDQDDGYGARGSVKIVRKTEAVDYVLEPYVRFWHIDDSEFSSVTFSGALVGFGLEPENETWEYGVRLGARF